MKRRQALLALVILAMLVGAVFGGIQIVLAMQGGNANTDMTKSVARIVFTGDYFGTHFNEHEICTGSVVGDGWVLTANHCLYSGGDIRLRPIPWSGLRIQLWQEGMNISAGYESKLDRAPVLLHGGAGFSSDNHSTLVRDVMLLHVASPMPAWAETIPMALTWPKLGTTFTEYGYGRVSENGSVSSYLEKSQQGAIWRIACPSGLIWTNGQLCVNTSNSHPWEGDSGGPLVWWNNGYWQQVGSFSQYVKSQTWRSYWSEADGDTRNWILSTIGANFAYGTILRDQASGTMWIYGTNGYEDDLYRHRIPDSATYNCLINNGATVPDPPPPLLTIEALPDMVGNDATCAPKPPTVVPPTATPPTVMPPTVAPPTVAPPTVIPTTVTPPTVTPAPHPVDAYSNYGQTNLVGHAMCRGNPGNPLSMPGGTGTQTFTVPAGVSTLSSAMVQIDPADVTGHLTMYVNGVAEATASAGAVGDTHFTFGPIRVRQGDTVKLSITFTATYGKIITLYTVGDPGGTFTAQNSCPDGAPSVTVTDGGLRAVVSGMS